MREKYLSLIVLDFERFLAENPCSMDPFWVEVFIVVVQREEPFHRQPIFIRFLGVGVQRLAIDVQDCLVVGFQDPSTGDDLDSVDSRPFENPCHFLVAAIRQTETAVLFLEEGSVEVHLIFWLCQKVSRNGQ